MRLYSPADQARPFIGRLEDEHDDVLRLLQTVLDKGNDVARDRDVRAMCWAVRTHLHSELDVFAPAVAEALPDSPLLVNAGRSAHAALNAIDLIDRARPALLRKAVVRLGALFMGHVLICEQTRGLHDVARTLPLDWPGLEARYLRSRHEHAQRPSLRRSTQWTLLAPPATLAPPTA